MLQNLFFVNLSLCVKSVSKKLSKIQESIAKYRLCISNFMLEKCLTENQPN